MKYLCRFQPERVRKPPLRKRDCAEEVREGAEPYLATQIPAMMIQLWKVLLVVATKQHNANQIGQGVLDDLPIPVSYTHLTLPTILLV